MKLYEHKLRMIPGYPNKYFDNFDAVKMVNSIFTPEQLSSIQNKKLNSNNIRRPLSTTVYNLNATDEKKNIFEHKKTRVNNLFDPFRTNKFCDKSNFYNFNYINKNNSKTIDEVISNNINSLPRIEKRKMFVVNSTTNKLKDYSNQNKENASIQTLFKKQLYIYQNVNTNQNNNILTDNENSINKINSSLIKTNQIKQKTSLQRGFCFI